MQSNRGEQLTVCAKKISPANKTSGIEIVSDPADTIPLASTVRKNADREKRALGFLPGPVYRAAAERGNLLVAVATSRGKRKYAGHLLFGGTFPRARVFQVFVSPKLRRRDIGRKLVQHLIELTQEYGYLSISARVAEDLEANRFWERLGFAAIRTMPGGEVRRRNIRVRVRELDTPRLFGTSMPNAPIDLGLVQRLGARTAVYAIDLNVFWDVVKRRARSEYAAHVISAGLHSLVQLVVTREFINELRRSSPADKPDPSLEFALQLPTLPEPEVTVREALVAELTEIVFPAGAHDKGLSSRKRSDLIHLATAIHHSATGFVTSDARLTKVGNSIFQKYGIEIVHVSQFSTALKASRMPVPALHARLSSETLRVSELHNFEKSEVVTFLDLVVAPATFRDDFLTQFAATFRRKLVSVSSGSEVVCLASWDANVGVSNRAHVRLIANEEHPAVDTALECMITMICSATSRMAPVLLELDLVPGQVASKRVALLRGFRPVHSSTGPDEQLRKVCVGRPVCAANWAKVRANLQRCSSLQFAEELPRFTAYDQAIPFTGADGAQRWVNLNDLETLLSPALFILPGRTGAVVPIRRGFADDLFGTSPQLSLTPGREALLFAERVYFSSARNSGVLRKGVPMFFYESGKDNGRASIIAMARITDTTVVMKSDVSATLLRHGVVDPADIEQLTATDKVAVTTFDSVLLPQIPISLNRLRALEIADGSNFVTARSITYDQVSTIMREGYAVD